MDNVSRLRARPKVMVSKVMNRLLIVLIGVMFCAPFCFAKDIYLAQNSAGASNGADCTNAHPTTWFNSSSSWGNASAQISPGDTVHLCGTLTGTAGSTMLTVQGSGAAGHPITILFEPNAVLAAPYWPYTTGAINCNNHAYITIDGGSNGLVENTADGTALTYQQDTLGINGGGSGCTNFTVENLHFSNMHIRTALSATDGADSIAIELSGSNALARNNTIDHVRDGIHVTYTSTSNLEISSNIMTFVETGTTIGDSNTNNTLTGAKIHDNDLGGGAYLWDTLSNSFHHDPIHIFCAHTGSTATGLQIYNNFIHGTWGNDQAYFNTSGGTHITSPVFIENAGPAQVFNNIIVLLGKLSQPADGFIYFKGTGSNNAKVFNNVLVSDNEGIGIAFAGSSGHDLRNNIFNGLEYAIYVPSGSSLTTSDYNDFFGSKNWGNFSTLASWQGQGFDLHSKQTDPKLDASFRPLSGSSVIGTGVNLTSLGISPLDTDILGVGRPGSGPWDLGAHVYGTAQSSAPVPPTGLAAVVQ